MAEKLPLAAQPVMGPWHTGSDWEDLGGIMGADTFGPPLISSKPRDAAVLPVGAAKFLVSRRSTFRWNSAHAVGLVPRTIQQEVHFGNVASTLSAYRCDLEQRVGAPSPRAARLPEYQAPSSFDGSPLVEVLR